MRKLSVRVSNALALCIVRVARRKRISKLELVMRAVVRYAAGQAELNCTPSALELAGDLVGSLYGLPPDLASGPERLKPYGR
jgi:hypothetical protein